MKLYLAAVYTSNFSKTSTIYAKLTEAEKAHRNRHPYILESYHYIHKESFVEKLRQDGCKIFLDSGAFSAFTKGTEIDLPSYCDYVRRNHDIIECVDGTYLFSVLDGIGDPFKTYQNQVLMERQGVRPLPCFHYGEDEKYLEYYIANYDYITLGGMVPITTKQLYHWLDRIWDRYLTRSDGSPRLKVHGFGLTTVKLMERYPWYSVDSSSWVQIAVHGNIIVPDNEHMRLKATEDTDDRPDRDRLIAISSDSPRKKEWGYHFDTLAENDRQALANVIEAQGFDVNRLKASAYSRWCFNFWAFHEINKRVTEENKKFKPEQPVLF